MMKKKILVWNVVALLATFGLLPVEVGYGAPELADRPASLTPGAPVLPAPHGSTVAQSTGTIKNAIQVFQTQGEKIITQLAQVPGNQVPMDEIRSDFQAVLDKLQAQSQQMQTMQVGDGHGATGQIGMVGILNSSSVEMAQGMNTVLEKVGVYEKAFGLNSSQGKTTLDVAKAEFAKTMSEEAKKVKKAKLGLVGDILNEAQQQQSAYEQSGGEGMAPEVASFLMAWAQADSQAVQGFVDNGSGKGAGSSGGTMDLALLEPSALFQALQSEVKELTMQVAVMDNNQIQRTSFYDLKNLEAMEVVSQSLSTVSVLQDRTLPQVTLLQANATVTEQANADRVLAAALLQKQTLDATAAASAAASAAALAAAQLSFDSNGVSPSTVSTRSVTLLYDSPSPVLTSDYSNISFNYLSWGVWENEQYQAPNSTEYVQTYALKYSSDYLTDGSSIPTSGTAIYTGPFLGNIGYGSTSASLDTAITMAVNFGTNTLTFTNGSTTSGSGSWTSSVNSITGTVSFNGTLAGLSASLSGSFAGAFFGETTTVTPTEIGATWAMYGTVGTSSAKGMGILAVK